VFEGLGIFIRNKLKCKIQIGTIKQRKQTKDIRDRRRGVRILCLTLRSLFKLDLSQATLLVINDAVCIVQRATAQSKTGIFRGYD
jgi:hypothetical protein